MLRLNLGCGKKLYPKDKGWVNIDLFAPKEEHNTIDVIDSKQLEVYNNNTIVDIPLFHQSDLKQLQFVDDNVADEIHAYHVIEHFFRLEVQDVLTEWKRVLKPGGKIFLEQPDVLKCAANFLSGYHRSDPDLKHKFGILGFYGDGTPDEPYMAHKWGWYPESLAYELKQAGFTGIKMTQALTHAKEKRDFRLVGTK